MARTYYTLLERNDGRWCIAFGDYDRATVAEEGDDIRERCPKLKMKIIATGAKQADIDAAVAKLNGEV